MSNISAFRIWDAQFEILRFEIMKTDRLNQSLPYGQSPGRRLLIIQNQNYHPHPHYRAPAVTYFEGSIRPISITPNLPTNIVGFGGLDSSTILIWMGGIPRFIGKFPERLSRALLVGKMLVGGLGVYGGHLQIQKLRSEPPMNKKR